MNNPLLQNLRGSFYFSSCPGTLLEMKSDHAFYLFELEARMWEAAMRLVSYIITHFRSSENFFII
jgi:hypothetical protein